MSSTCSSNTNTNTNKNTTQIIGHRPVTSNPTNMAGQLFPMSSTFSPGFTTHHCHNHHQVVLWICVVCGLDQKLAANLTENFCIWGMGFPSLGLSNVQIWEWYRKTYTKAIIIHDMHTSQERYFPTVYCTFSCEYHHQCKWVFISVDWQLFVCPPHGLVVAGMTSINQCQCNSRRDHPDSMTPAELPVAEDIVSPLIWPSPPPPSMCVGSYMATPMASYEMPPG